MPIIFYIPLLIAGGIIFFLGLKMKQGSNINPFRSFNFGKNVAKPKPMPIMPTIDYSQWIGQKVYKNKFKTKINKAPKPFKSGKKVNTVKDVIIHPQLGVPAFTFYEDDSYVACNICRLA